MNFRAGDMFTPNVESHICCLSFPNENFFEMLNQLFVVSRNPNVQQNPAAIPDKKIDDNVPSSLPRTQSMLVQTQTQKTNLRTALLGLEHDLFRLDFDLGVQSTPQVSTRLPKDSLVLETIAQRCQKCTTITPQSGAKREHNVFKQPTFFTKTNEHKTQQHTRW